MNGLTLLVLIVSAFAIAVVFRACDIPWPVTVTVLAAFMFFYFVITEAPQ